MRRTIAAVVGAVLFLAGCGTDAATADVCTSSTELQTSVQALADVEPVQVGAEGVGSAGETVQQARDARGCGHRRGPSQRPHRRRAGIRGAARLR
jgi:outer membrane murein-binding lipoprotein Lpp